MPESTSTQKGLKKFIRSCIEDGKFPGAVVVVSEKGEKIFRCAEGHAVVVPKKVPIKPDTIFDVASLTKPLITAFLVLLLDQEGAVSIHDPVSRYLEEFMRPDKERITVLDCLCHRAGFRAWMPLYLYGETLGEYMANIAKESLAYSTGTRAEYSCLDYIVLGAVLKRASGQSVGRLAGDRLFAPLGLKRSYFPLPRHLRELSAATEKGSRCEREMARDFSPQNSEWQWNDEIVWGVVHDGNARVLGAEAGNSGLFIAVDDLHRLAREFLPSTMNFLHEGHKPLVMRNQIPYGDTRFSAGWELNSGRLTSAGASLPACAYGHTGFTGTSIWIDPVRERMYLLLTNRIHPECGDINMNEIRRTFHSIAVSL